MSGFYIWLFIIGAAVGSFLNVIAVRYNPDKWLWHGEHAGGRSRCPKCRRQLRWFELVPFVSFIVQRRRCRTCRGLISWQYPIIEGLAGAVTVLIAMRVSEMYLVKQHWLAGLTITWPVVLAILWIMAAYGLLLMAAIDWRLKIIPDELTGFLFLIGTVITGIQMQVAGTFDLLAGSWLGRFASMFAFGLRDSALVSHGGALLIGLLFFGAIVVLSRGRGMGMGDVKLAAALGWLLAWPDTGLVLLLSFIIGAIGCLGLIWQKGGQMKQEVPFGPFLAAASLLVIIWGETIIEGYLRIFGLV